MMSSLQPRRLNWSRVGQCLHPPVMAANTDKNSSEEKEKNHLFIFLRTAQCYHWLNIADLLHVATITKYEGPENEGHIRWCRPCCPPLHWTALNPTPKKVWTTPRTLTSSGHWTQGPASEPHGRHKESDWGGSWHYEEGKMPISLQS